MDEKSLPDCLFSRFWFPKSLTLPVFVSRGFQGVGGTATVPSALGILAHAFSPSRAHSMAGVSGLFSFDVDFPYRNLSNVTTGTALPLSQLGWF
ncbi:hypothetical protein F4604DRAFT_1775021 [Suillus subluteus]|nr:hypothetical protein F4604DRAFT_1775021 [Suillus subluteus]